MLKEPLSQKKWAELELCAEVHSWCHNDLQHELFQRAIQHVCTVCTAILSSKEQHWTAKPIQ